MYEVPLTRLRKEVEAEVGRRMKTPKDFEYLSALILERQHEAVSVSTLKRLWGYIQASSNPRSSTLDVLVRFVGGTDWDTYCKEEEDAPSSSPHSVQADTSQHSSIISNFKSSNFKFAVTDLRFAIMLVVAVVVAVVGFAAWRSSTSSVSEVSHVLRCGQTFASVGDYLRLFGVTDTAYAWSRPLPHHIGIILWGPEYRHPEWHNNGNADSLMPTITEYWQPAKGTDIPDEVIATRNADNYLRATSFSELRITFMKGLGQKSNGSTSLHDTTYTFLGIYRLNTAASDTAHLVWQRVADECDLANLGYLEQLRH